MKSLKAFCVLSLFALAAAGLAAYDPPPGGEAVSGWGSPLSMGGSPSVVSDDGPSSSSLNPAAEAAEQRVTLDASYIALIGLGAEQGWGSVANLDASMPATYGVWGAGLKAIIVPAGLSSMPLGTRFDFRGTFAKALWPDLYVGAGLDFTVGSQALMDWGLAADLGFIHKAGTLSFMKDFRWGAVVYGLGKWYSPSATTDSAGVGDIDTAFPSPFSVKAGAGFDLVQLPSFRLSADGDLALPFFQNAVLDLGLGASIKDVFGFRVGWGLNLRELLAGTSASLLPSFALTANIPITTSKKADSFLSKQGWDRSELRPHLSAAPLYGGAWAFGAGVTMPLGVVDKNPPKVSLSYPATPYDLYYVSPNADGKNDGLDLGLSIADERFVEGYVLTVTDKDGKVVRTISNKQPPLPADGVKAVWSRLVYNEKGIPVPSEIRWDGRTDSGAVAPDGTYTLTLEAWDDNGNKVDVHPSKAAVDASGAPTKVEVAQVAVDSTPPSLDAKAPADLVFSPDGDGNKDSITFPFSGSAEDKWTVQVADSTGTVVRTMTIANQALSAVTWDGKNDAGAVVPDGFYKLTVSSTDRAQNSASASVDNILVDTRQPPVSLSIDTSAFSPNGDGSRDSVTFQPSAPVKSGLSSWTLSVLDASGAVRWTVGGSSADSLKPSYVFDGKDSSGKVLPEGGYQATFQAKYQNGYQPKATSPSFVLDVTAPSATVSADLAAFSPDGDGKQDTDTFSQTSSPEDLWTGEVTDSSGKAVKSFRYSGKADATQVWDGTNDDGARVADGAYGYRLRSTDRAGNSGSSNAVSIQLDTSKKTVMLSSDLNAFSPNGDGVKDAVSLIPSVQSPGSVSEWRIAIADGSGNPVRTWSGKGAPAAKYAWDGKSNDGKLLPDGSYSASLWVKYAAGTELSSAAPLIALDTTFPSLELKASDLVFSPNGDGKKDSIAFTQRNSTPDSWTGNILDASGKTVRTWTWKTGAGDFEWDGRDQAGNVVPDGRYRYLVSADDKAGNHGERSVDGITVDTRDTDIFVTANRAGFSPNGDKVMDDVTFGFVERLKDGIASWSFKIVDGANPAAAPRRSWNGTGASSLPAQIVWDGKGDDGKIVEGGYVGVFGVTYLKGDAPEAKSQPVTLDITPPALKTGVSPNPFSPDNDGVDDEVNIALSVRDASDIASWKLEIMENAVVEGSGAAQSRVFMKYEGTGKPAEKITWDGKSLKGELVESATDYTAVFTVADSVGNVATLSTPVSVDVLVMRDGDKLRIIIPSIVFRPNAGDFNGLAPDVVSNNQYVLKRIAQILNKYRSYRVTIEGYANSIGKIYGYSADKIQKEESTELLPLSQSRADAVKNFLVELGVSASRLSTVGQGSANPVVDPKDAENRWKNRRVQFILEK